MTAVAATAKVPWGSPRLSCAGVSVHFGGIAALENVDLQVPQNAIVGLVGPNGAGKSTLFGVFSGLLQPNHGKVVLEGEDVTASRPQRRADLGLARTFQHPELFVGLTIREHLVLAYRAKHARRRVLTDLFTVGSLRPTDAAERAAVDETLELLGLVPYAQRQAMGLPLGIARLLELGRAIAASPRVLMLDEPSSGLDDTDTARFEAVLTQVARERGISVLLVEHDVDLVMRMCELIYVLDFGEIIASGTPDEVRNDPNVRAAYLGEKLPGDTAQPTTDLSPAPTGSEEPSTPVASADAPAAPVAVRVTDPAAAVAPTAGPRPSLLSVSGLSVSYADAVALTDVSFDLGSGMALAILGANGAGKSTLARALAGLVPSEGRVVFNGQDITGWPADRIRKAGLMLLPEGRGIFRQLTVTENLKMATGTIKGRQARRQSIERALTFFPALGRRLGQPAGRLSGGEQQMLSLARALANAPRLLIADELSLGLAPIMVDVVFRGLEQAKRAGITVMMAEQYIHRALSFAEEGLVLQRGQVAWRGPSAEAEGEVLRHYLGGGLMATT